MTWVKLSAATSFLLLPFMVMAQPNGHAQERDSIPPVVIGGFVDSYFSWNGARPTSHVNRFRNFDLTENQFVLSEAQVDIERRAAPIGFHIALNTGAASDIIHAGNTSTLNLLMQGFVSLMVPVGAGLTVDAGKFVTHMGFETINAKDNFNYSRSFLFAWAIPYYHVGVRAAYPLLEQLLIGASMSNGWNAASVQNGKTFGATLAYTPVHNFSFSANWIGGPGQSDSLNAPFRQIAEVISSVRIAEHFTVVADALYGVEKVPGQYVAWKGGAVYGRYAVTENSAISLRGEIYDDPHGFTTGFIQTLKEITLTYEHKVLENMLVRVEYRHDRSNVSVFDGSGGNGTEFQQNTIALSGIVAF
ncbi:porin [bacterium]|nr:MAG: porin [bacterium]